VYAAFRPLLVTEEQANKTVSLNTDRTTARLHSIYDCTATARARGRSSTTARWHVVNDC